MRRCSRRCTRWRPKAEPDRAAGKQLFYDARDTRLAREGYMSCASCHNDGGGDGRVWDLTGMGEGLRNTVSLRGQRGMAQGFLHWSAQLRRSAGLRGSDPRARRRHRADVGRAVQPGHAQPAAGRSQGGRERRPRRARGVCRVAQPSAQSLSQPGRHADAATASPAGRSSRRRVARMPRRREFHDERCRRPARRWHDCQPDSGTRLGGHVDRDRSADAARASGRRHRICTTARQRHYRTPFNATTLLRSGKRT